MAAGAGTHAMIAAFLEEAEAPMFLSGLFTTSPRHIHTKEEVDVDVMRDDEHIAIAIQDLTTGTRMNEASKYTAKSFRPPIFNEEGIVTAYELIKRGAGHTPHDPIDFGVRAGEEAFVIGHRLDRKVKRAIEAMAAQVLQTGKLTLTDENGTELYALDFGPKATHFVTVPTDWGTGTEDKLADLEALAKTVRTDGYRKPHRLVFGDRAFSRFVDDDAVKARLDTRNMMLGQVAPEVRGEGATFQGWIWLGHYRFEMWTYDGSYRDPQTGDHVPYLAQDNVIMLSEGGRLDLTFGAIPIIRRPEERALAFLPPRISSAERGLDLTINSWFSPDGTTLHVSYGTRPLTIPTAIDTYGCLQTVA